MSSFRYHYRDQERGGIESQRCLRGKRGHCGATGPIGCTGPPGPQGLPGCTGPAVNLESVFTQIQRIETSVNTILASIQQLSDRVFSIETNITELQRLTGTESLVAIISQETARAVATEHNLSVTCSAAIAAETARALSAEETINAKVNVKTAAASSFFTAFANSVYISNADGTAEFDYSDLLGNNFVPAGVTGTPSLVSLPRL